MVRRLLGAQFEAALNSNLYVGYNVYLEKHQHFRRKHVLTLGQFPLK